MQTRRAMVSRSGRLSLPSEFRKALGLAGGGHVIVTLEGAELRIYTPAEAVRQAQEISRRILGGKSGTTVDEFLAERHREAERE